MSQATGRLVPEQAGNMMSKTFQFSSSGRMILLEVVKWGVTGSRSVRRLLWEPGVR